MTDKAKEHFTQQTPSSLTDFEDHELRATMEEFLEKEKKANTNIWNFATIAGIAMFFVGMVYFIQLIGLAIGPDLSGLIEILPIVGGVLVTFVGFGFLVGDREKRKDGKRKYRKKRYGDFNFDLDEEEEDAFGLKNDFDSKRGRRKRGHSTFDMDSYAYRQSKKLYKSRTDRKCAGVCGGLAKYFGISSTVIRLLFVVTFFAASGTSLLVYIALAIALNKEPPELMDDFEY